MISGSSRLRNCFEDIQFFAPSRIRGTTEPVPPGTSSQTWIISACSTTSNIIGLYETHTQATKALHDSTASQFGDLTEAVLVRSQSGLSVMHHIQAAQALQTGGMAVFDWWQVYNSERMDDQGAAQFHTWMCFCPRIKAPSSAALLPV